MLSLDRGLIKSALEQRYSGRVEDLQSAWDTLGKCLRRTPSRATVFRWINGNLPRNRCDFLVFCGLLDLDPMAMLCLPDGREAEAVHHLSRSFWLNSWKQPALGFLTEFFGHHADWPPKLLSRRYFRRDWTICEFEHKADVDVNYYGTIEVSACPFSHGQTFHFAYSQRSAVISPWIQYGFVERRDCSVRLFNYNGRFDRCVCASKHDPCVIQTWFGPSPSTFRVASLHPFKLKLLHSDESRACKVVFWL